MDRPKNKKKKRMVINDGCSFCGGRVKEKYVRKASLWGDKLMEIIDNVTAGACEQCGERYYQAKVFKEIEILIKKKKFENTVSVPFTEFSNT